MSPAPAARRLGSTAPRKFRTPVAVAAAVAVAAVATAWFWWPVRPAVDGPIILISIDTLRADHLPTYGYTKVRTPAIDALSADGVVFERAYAHAPLTLPSHASIFTGRLPFEHGVRDNIGFNVKQGEAVLSGMLRRNGFSTGAVVSAYVLRKETGIDQGFDFYDSQFAPVSPEVPIAQVQRDGAQSLQVAERWISGLTSPQFFLFLHLYEPHKPYTPPSRFAVYAPYDGEIAYADEIVGRLTAYLRARDLYESATILLLSDHGEGLGDHGELEHGLFIYEESIRIPLIVKLPGGREAGRRVGQPVQHVDLVPTLLDLVGAPDAAAVTGRSIRPLLEGRRSDEPHVGIYSESLYPRYHFGWSELYALTDERFRLIRAPRDELYDLQRDHGERTNVADDRPQARQAMRAALDRILTRARIDKPSAVSDEQREQLQALGYVGAQASVAPDVPGETLPDPKDKVQVLERYRRAVELAGERKFGDAVTLLQGILAENPAMADVWQQLGNLLMRLGRVDESVRAHRRFVELKPDNPGGLISVAAALLKMQKLDDAQAHAELAARVARKQDSKAQAGAYELLAKIALKRKDRTAAERYAVLAQEADPSLPMPIYVQGLIRHAEGRYAEALPYFEEALRQSTARTITMTELHFHTGDTLARLGRNAEAETQFRKEIDLFPQNLRARASLAMLLRSIGRDADADRAIVDLMRAAPTPEGLGLAEQLWRMFGEPERAMAVRAAAQRLKATPAARP
jgi:arylsulfatase A-like enzyme/Flp pilus assembly protein TadD